MKRLCYRQYFLRDRHLGTTEVGAHLSQAELHGNKALVISEVFCWSQFLFEIHLKNLLNHLFEGKGRVSVISWKSLWHLAVWGSFILLGCFKIRRGNINRCPWQLNGCCHVSTLWSRWRFYRAESLVWRDNDQKNITECIKIQKLVFIWISQLLIDLLPLFKESDTILRQWWQCPSVVCAHTAYANPMSSTDACLMQWEHQGEKQGHTRAATLKWWNHWNQRPLL